MANVKHIYSGAGDPADVLGALTGIAGHHYLDTSTGDVYIANSYDDWIKVNDPIATGVNDKLGVVSAPVAPTDPAEEPTLWLNTSNGDAYISVVTGGPISPVWSWKKMTLT